MSNQDRRRAEVRRHVAQAQHHLTEALTADDPDALVALIGEADSELAQARDETLRESLA